jgi:hypothetical protein
VEIESKEKVVIPNKSPNFAVSGYMYARLAKVSFKFNVFKA